MMSPERRFIARPGSASAPRILIVEDDRDLALLIGYNLEAEGYVVESVTRGDEAELRLAENAPDLVILDWMLPCVSGLEICRRLRAREATRTLPVIMVTARGEEAERVRGFSVGADDYVVKPFSPRELVARVKALLRRAHLLAEPESAGVFERGRLRIDFDSYEVFVGGERKELALREFELLRFLVQHPMRVYSREQLLDMVWGRDTFVEPRTVDVHIRRLRKHIEREDSNPELILTVRSVGYRFNPDALG